MAEKRIVDYIHKFESMSMDHNNGSSKLGLVCHYQFEDGSSQFAFLDVRNGGKYAAIDHSISFSTQYFVQVLASSGDYILLSSFNGDGTLYNVFNPLTKESFLVPQPCCIVGRIIGAGLASSHECQFEVVLVEELCSVPNGLNLHIFSSYTLEWRTHKAADLSDFTLPEFEFRELSTFPLYSNGAIHWKTNGHLLVFHVEGGNCELFELPNSFEVWSMQCGCLCESKGYVYYCYSDYDGFHVWSLIKEDDRYGSLCAGFDIDLGRFRWRLVHSLGSDDFDSKHYLFCGCFFDWEPYKVTPIAYDAQAQTIYLQLPGNVVSFNFSTGDLESVCRYSYRAANFNCCSFFPSIASSFCNQGSEKNLAASEDMEITLPIAEIMFWCIEGETIAF